MKDNLEKAFSIILERKNENSALKFRLETCVSKESVKVYVIQEHNKIIEVVTIENGVARLKVK